MFSETSVPNMIQKTLTAVKPSALKFPWKRPTHHHAPSRTCNTDLTELDQLNAVGQPEARGYSCRLDSPRQLPLCDVTQVKEPQWTAVWSGMCPDISQDSPAVHISQRDVTCKDISLRQTDRPTNARGIINSPL